MAQASIAQQHGHGWQHVPLTTPRRARDEAYWLSLELRKEGLGKHEALREAIHILASGELGDYADAWDVMAYQAGNKAGMPF